MVSLPDDFVRQTKLVMGEERFGRFIEAFNEDAPTSIRLNPKKITQGDRHSVQFSEDCTECLSPCVIPWCEEGYYLEGRPQFTFDPLFHAGCYYVQEAASMFISHVIRSLFTPDSAPSTVLDLCAAPGGKSTAIRTVLPKESILVSNEPVPTRAQILLENITKWDWDNCIVTHN